MTTDAELIYTKMELIIAELSSFLIHLSLRVILVFSYVINKNQIKTS